MDHHQPIRPIAPAIFVPEGLYLEAGFASRITVPITATTPHADRSLRYALRMEC